MERYFTPVRGSSEDEVKIYKHHHHTAHQHPVNQHYRQNQYHQHPGSHSHSSSSSHGKPRDRQSQRHHDNQHRSYHPPHPKEPVELKRSSSSLSSSSSSSSSSACWTSEPSLDEETYLSHKPQHSLSCSNIPEVQRKAHGRESTFGLDHGEQMHRHSLENAGRLLPGAQHGHRTPKLSRGHSKSEEALQQNKAGSEPDHGTLYKTASLGHSLAFNTQGPKKAVSSIQLPSKGILKNKDEGQNQGNFRKARSMEVLSTRVNVTAASKQISMEAARDNFVKGKLQFSAFLDEITRQVISPGELSSFGVSAQTPPKSPNEERRKLESVPPAEKQHKIRPDSGKTDSSSQSRSHKRANKHQHRNLSSPPPAPQMGRHPAKAQRHGPSSGKHHTQYSQLLTDGTSTSPETIHRHRTPHPSSHGPGRHLQSKEKASPPPLRAESESQSSKSSTSASSEKSDRHNTHPAHRRQSKTHRESVASVDRVQMLEEYNRELHENLLQTVACIENMETELQCTKAELINYKDKYRRLQESYSVSQQANGVLEQKLKSAADSLDSEKSFLMQRTADLTKQLDSAQKTISSLENINVPSLIRELLKSHFDSQEALENLCRRSPGRADSEHSELRNKPSTGEKGEVSEWPRQQPNTAFVPWKHEHDPWAEPFTLKGSNSQLPFSFVDDVPVHKMVADTKAPNHQAPQLAVNTEIHVIPPNPYNLDQTRLGGDGSLTDLSYLSAQRLLNEFLNQIPPPKHEDGEGKTSLEALMGTRELTQGKQ